MRYPSSVAVAVCALLLAASGGAQDLDEKGMRESLKKSGKVPSAVGAAVAKEAKEAAKGSALELASEDDYKKLVGNAKHAFVAFYAKSQEKEFAVAKKAMAEFAKKHGEKVAVGYMEKSPADKAGITKSLSVPEHATPYFVLVKKKKRAHGFDNADHTGIKIDGKPVKFSRVEYYEAAAHHCLTELELKPEPKKVPCNR